MSYTVIKAIAAGIAASTAVRDFCIAKYGRGCLVRIDDFAAAPLTESDAPFVLILNAPSSGDGGPVAEADESRIDLLAAIRATTNEATVTTARTASANGYEQLGQAEDAEALRDLAITAARAVNHADQSMIQTVSKDADGSTAFPLQVAAAEIIISKPRTMQD